VQILEQEILKKIFACASLTPHEAVILTDISNKKHVERQRTGRLDFKNE